MLIAFELVEPPESRRRRSEGFYGPFQISKGPNNRFLDSRKIVSAFHCQHHRRPVAPRPAGCQEQAARRRRRELTALAISAFYIRKMEQDRIPATPFGDRPDTVMLILDSGRYGQAALGIALSREGGWRPSPLPDGSNSGEPSIPLGLGRETGYDIPV